MGGADLVYKVYNTSQSVEALALAMVLGQSNWRHHQQLQDTPNSSETAPSDTSGGLVAVADAVWK